MMLSSAITQADLTPRRAGGRAMTEPRIEDLPPDILWWCVISHFGSVEMFVANMLWYERVEPTPERVAAGTEAFKEGIAARGEHLPIDEHIAALRAYWDNGNRWT
jgi:hypothetical protein